jgi:8-oxo-dGTP pyrophosphatase MutT (NUDIX family)
MPLASLLDPPLRLIMNVLHLTLKGSWFVRRPRTQGVHALALTPEGNLILVRLRYAGGWRIPGGGRKKEEDAKIAVLRELREEIGLQSHGEIQWACDLEQQTNFKRDLCSLFIVRDVHYRPPRWSWEVEDWLECPIDQLPPDLSPRTARWIQTLLPNL